QALRSQWRRNWAIGLWQLWVESGHSAPQNRRFELTSPGGKRRQAQLVGTMQNARVHEALAEALSARGYEQLTPVQSAVVAEEADGRDLIVSAKTGSGKTVAFGM